MISDELPQQSAVEPTSPPPVSDDGAQRLQAVGEAMNSLTHESRNALQMLYASLEMLLRRTQSQPDAVRLINEVRSSADRLHKIYEGVREYVSPISLKIEPCDLGVLMKLAWSSLISAHPQRRARFLQEVGNANVHCQVDTRYFEQAVHNVLEYLLCNCRDPVRIVARWEAEEFANQCRVRAVQEDDDPAQSGKLGGSGDNVSSSVRDTRMRGTPLGLDMAKRIVQAHGGELVSSEIERGAEVIMTVPHNCAAKTL